jgi:hypothetical protein
MFFVLAAALISSAATQEAARPQLSLTTKPSPPKPKPPPTTPPKSDDVNLLPEEAKPDAAATARLETQLTTRRTMLGWHQVGGFATLGSLTATVVLGQLNYTDKYGGGGDTGKYYQWHRWVAITSATIFAGTAALAVFAPSPIARPARLDTATLHKVSMAVASAGMVTQIILGIVTASKEGQPVQRDFAMAHQIIGYTTLAATATGFAVLTF